MVLLALLYLGGDKRDGRRVGGPPQGQPDSRSPPETGLFHLGFSEIEARRIVLETDIGGPDRHS